MYSELLPQPRQVNLQQGTCTLSSLTHGSINNLPDSALELLRADLPDLSLASKAGGDFSAIFGCSSDFPPIDAQLSERLPEQEQGFILRAAADRIEIQGRDAAGLWYGLQTLVQLRRMSAGPLPAAEIRDWPAIRYRGVHVDLKGYQPRFERLLESFRILSHARINVVLLEVEDKYDYACAPGVGVPGAYTAAQFRQLSELAHALSIQIVPKLQCLGHVDYLLQHERYHHLREDGHPFQFCPRNEEGMELWKKMATELCDCFSGHDFFHIGADETGNLGQCPICREYSKADSYVHRVQQCIDAVRQAGREPILWEDILRNLHGNLDESELERTWTLGDDAILMYWAYGYGGSGNSFPLLPRYLERDMKVWGASGFSGCGPSWIQNVPPLTERALNISAWTKTAVENDLEGVVATGWTRIASADPPAESLEASWFPILYAAESTWVGRERELLEFCRIASQSLFGADISGLYSRFLLSMEAGDLPAEGVEIEALRNRERLALLRAAAAVAAHDRRRTELQETLQIYHGRWGDRMPDYRLGLVRGRTESFRRSLSQCRDDLETSLAALYETGTVADVIRSRFGRDAELLAHAEALLEKTELI
ncbi:MAG: family 20 glycosylhydrolase [Gemmatimonadetes bacterium]|jgi:hypothetical protein|nr:family 20 glycosylhydrolase [Gemmatimonadota bacterium]